MSRRRTTETAGHACMAEKDCFSWVRIPRYCWCSMPEWAADTALRCIPLIRWDAGGTYGVFTPVPCWRNLLPHKRKPDICPAVFFWDNFSFRICIIRITELYSLINCNISCSTFAVELVYTVIFRQYPLKPVRGRSYLRSSSVKMFRWDCMFTSFRMLACTMNATPDGASELVCWKCSAFYEMCSQLRWIPQWRIGESAGD